MVQPRPRVSVIIPVRDEPRVADAVRSVLGQAGAEAIGEILVVGSDAPRAVPADDRVRFVDNGPQPLASVNRNRGMAEAAGEWRLFLDADCVAQPGWLQALCGALKMRPAVSGAVLADGGDYWATAYNVSSFHEFRAGLPGAARAHLPTLTLGVTRAACDAAGPFDSAYDPCEDMEWTIRMARAGVPLYFEPAAQVVHRPRASAAIVWRKWTHNGHASAAIRRRYPDVAYDTHSAGLLARPGWLRILAPGIALVVSARVFRSPAAWRYLHTFPAVYLSKVAWCLGAARP